MTLITSSQQLHQNLEYLESDAVRGSRDHKNFVKNGICFVVYDSFNGPAFAPSRFLGYAGNTFESHAANIDKDGRETNPAITAILDHKPQLSDDCESLYSAYCLSLRIDAKPTGNFGVRRKYWDIRQTKTV